jgi:hypothetical protein
MLSVARVRSVTIQPRYSEIGKKCEGEHDQIDARSGDRIGARGGLFSTWQSAVSWREPVASRDHTAGGIFCRGPRHAAGRAGRSDTTRQRARNTCEWRDSLTGCGRARWHTACGCAGHDTCSCARDATSGSAGRAATAA